jgi:hypothetical protein
MFAVTYNNQVILGPMLWNRGLFQSALSSRSISEFVPRTPPDNFPLMLGEQIKIYKVQEVKPNINPLVEYHRGPTWEITESSATAHYEVLDLPLESAKYNVKQLAAAERFKRESAGTTAVIQDVEVTLETARGERDIFLQKYILMPDEATVNWKFPEAWLVLTKAELGAVVAAGASYIQSKFDWESTLSGQIDSATTKQQLLDIVEEINGV